MSQLRALLCGLVLGLALVYSGCDDDDDDDDIPVVPVTRPDGGIGETDGDGGTEFTTFVRTLIVDDTDETGQPTTTEDKTFVDTEPADAFPPAFFQ
jgi:hypothetical protein